MQWNKTLVSTLARTTTRTTTRAAAGANFKADPATFLVPLIPCAILVTASIPVTGSAYFIPAIPFFPASPLLPLADLLPGLGALEAGLGMTIFIALIVIVLIADLAHDLYLRRGCIVTLVAGMAIWNLLATTPLADMGANAPLGDMESNTPANSGTAAQTATSTAAQTATGTFSGPTSGPTSETGQQMEKTETNLQHWREWFILPTITKRTQWLAIRNIVPSGSTLILGENTFAADDAESRAFWCDVAIKRELTIMLGVEEPYYERARGAVWLLDERTCTNRQTAGQPHRQTRALYRARVGVPELTGTWGFMDSWSPTLPLGELRLDSNTALDEDWSGSNIQSQVKSPVQSQVQPPVQARIQWLICLEAFLPRVWFEKWWQGRKDMNDASRTRPGSDGAADKPDVIIVANDTPLGSFPVHVLRRKTATAMAGMLAMGAVHQARTGRTILVKVNQQPRQAWLARQAQQSWPFEPTAAFGQAGQIQSPTALSPSQPPAQLPVQVPKLTPDQAPTQIPIQVPTQIPTKASPKERTLSP